MRTRACILVAVAAVLASACADDPIGPPRQAAAPSPPRHAGPTVTEHPFADRHTPLQRSLMQVVADRRAAGLPVPDSVAFAFDDRPATPTAALRRLEGVDGEIGDAVTATTTIRFGNPAQAGLDRWPAIEVRGSAPAGATGYIREGDYTAAIRQQIAEQHPDANVDFDTGERTYTITETIVDRTAPETPGILGLTDRQLLNLTSSGGMLMGFTVLGPGIDYHIEYNLDVCIIWFFGCVVEWDVVDFWAGFVLDWTIMTRLPLDVSLTSTDPVLEGTTFTPRTAATGRDWSAADYTLAGLAAENGNEFVLRFRFGLGVFLTVSYIPVVDWGIPPIDIDRTASFATPLGPGQMFALPSLNLSLWSLDVALAAADFGVQLTPLLGSDRYTADWTASGSGAGSGSVTYTTSGQGEDLGAIRAADGPGDARVTLGNFRYHFTNFGLDIGLYFYLMVAGWNHTWPIPITQFSLTGIMGGPHVGSHAGTPGTLDLRVPVTNVRPSAVIRRTGGIPRGGRTVMLAAIDAPPPFTGDASDPGDDDLTLGWRWGDGTPDAFTTYPVPHTVREEKTHRFPRPCLYEVTFEARDDDGDVGADHVPVILTGAATNAVLPTDFWIRQYTAGYRRELNGEIAHCYLGIVGFMSEVFGETRDVSTPAAAVDVLWQRTAGGEGQRLFDRSLLLAWLNFAHGGFDWMEMVDSNNDRVPDIPFSRLMAAAEALRRNPATTDMQLRRFSWKLNGAVIAAQP